MPTKTSAPAVQATDTDRPELSRLAIVDRALEIADVEGIAGITVRRLATEFGVTPMALYWHVKNKDELLEAMGDRFYDGLVGLERLSDDTEAWTERLRLAVELLVGSFRKHPGAAHLAAPRIMMCDAGRDLAEETLAMLHRQGFSISAATDIGRIAIQTAAMLVIEMAGAEVGVPEEKRAAVRETKRSALAALPPDRYPSLVQCSSVLTHVDDEAAYFRFGVALFIGGVEALHAKLSD